jgi:hypothetical protein
VPEGCYVFEGKSASQFSRPPYICSFKSELNDFQFTYISVHLSPDKEQLTKELSALSTVYAGAIRRFPQASMTIIGGDTK